MHKRILIPLLLALALVLAACASTDSEDTTTTAASGTEETTTTAAGTDETTTTAAETTTTEDPMAAWPDKVVYGFIPSEQAETLGDSIQPYMDFLSEALGIEVEGVVTQDYNGLVVAMGAGQADFGAFGPFGYVQAEALYPIS